MKTTMKLLKCFLVTLSIIAFTASCQKDNLEDAVIPQTAQGEQVTSSQNGTNGVQGEQGEKGPKGDKGDQGEPGVAGPEGPAGQDGEAIGVPGPKGDTGATGATGPEGPTGDAGPKGDTGTAGTNGTNGIDGEDGNANVRAFRYKMAGVQGTFHRHYMSEITKSVRENDVILSYLTPKYNTILSFPIPGKINLAPREEIQVDIYYTSGEVTLRFRNQAGADFRVTTGQLSELKVIIIKSSSVTTGKSANESVRKELRAAGVDLTNYDEVMAHYGLKG